MTSRAPSTSRPSESPSAPPVGKPGPVCGSTAGAVEPPGWLVRGEDEVAGAPPEEEITTGDDDVDAGLLVVGGAELVAGLLVVGGGDVVVAGGDVDVAGADVVVGGFVVVGGLVVGGLVVAGALDEPLASQLTSTTGDCASTSVSWLPSEPAYNVAR